MEPMMNLIENDKLTLMMHVKQVPHSTIYYATNLPNWYEMLGMFSLYCIIAMSVFNAGLLIASRYMSP